MSRTCGLFDMVRIDHFRGFDSAWAIPKDDQNAINGTWSEGPKDEILQAIIDVAGDTLIIAEDLGIIPDSVVELRRRHNLPGMSVLHFGFDDDNVDNPHRPQNLTKSNIVYTGTHDNDTTMGWWENVDEKLKKRVEAVGLAGENPCETLIRIAMSSPAPLAVVPLQDILELGTEARMNTPGKTDGNWKWKFDWSELANGKWGLMRRSES